MVLTVNMVKKNISKKRSDDRIPGDDRKRKDITLEEKLDVINLKITLLLHQVTFIFFQGKVLHLLYDFIIRYECNIYLDCAILCVRLTTKFFRFRVICT